MAARIQTRSKNATTHPALPIIQLDEELDSDRKVERESKKRKAADKKRRQKHALAKKLASLEQDIADEDARNDTPRAPQLKARKSAVSKPRHIREDSTTPDSEALGTEEPPSPCPDEEESDDKTDAPTEYEQPEQEQNESSDSEASQDDMPPPKKMPARTTKKQSTRTAKKVVAGEKPMAKKRSIQDALDQESELDAGDEDLVDATPKPKGKLTVGKGKGLRRVTKSTKRGRIDLTVSIPVRIDGPQS
jgi:hypothetical protein